MPAGVVNRIGPYIIPSAAAPGSITINSVTVSDATITTSEYTTVTISTDVNADFITAEINDEWFAIEMDSEVGAVRTWILTLQGSQIGACSAEAVTVYAGASGSNTAVDSGTTLTVTASPATYATVVKNILNWIQDQLQAASVGTYVHLGALDNTSIYLGFQRKPTQYAGPAIYIDPMEDNPEVITVDPSEETNINIAITVYNVGEYTEDTLLTDNINLAGDVYDFLMLDTNRELGGNATFSTITNTNYGFNQATNISARWTQFTLQVRHNTRVT